jgi:hypothetical protein
MRKDSLQNDRSVICAFSQLLQRGHQHLAVRVLARRCAKSHDGSLDVQGLQPPPRKGGRAGLGEESAGEEDDFALTIRNTVWEP